MRLKREYPSWGAPKIRERLRRKYPDLRCPAISTVHAVLDRHGLVERRVRRRYKARGTALSRPLQPNELWCADFKGEFMLADRRYCFPLTITDFATRYLLRCEALSSTKEGTAFTVFERTFQEFGLPLAIRTDNGIPFGCGNALYGLTRLSVWWLRLGIGIERIKPGHPEQNGRHERMHLTLKREATKPAAPNFLQQQARFDAFVARYNDERPHEALEMRVPADDYARSPRPYRGLGELEYPFHDWTAIVTTCGRICYEKRKVNSVRSSPARRSASPRSASTSGSSASWTTTWGTLMTRRAGWNRSRTRFGRKCYPCLRNELSLVFNPSTQRSPLV